MKSTLVCPDQDSYNISSRDLHLLSTLIVVQITVCHYVCPSLVSCSLNFFKQVIQFECDTQKVQCWKLNLQIYMLIVFGDECRLDEFQRVNLHNNTRGCGRRAHPGWQACSVLPLDAAKRPHCMPRRCWPCAFGLLTTVHKLLFLRKHSVLDTLVNQQKTEWRW